MREGSEGDLIKDHTLPAEFAPFYPKGFFLHIKIYDIFTAQVLVIGDISINKYYYHYYYYSYHY